MPKVCEYKKFKIYEVVDVLSQSYPKEINAISNTLHDARKLAKYLVKRTGSAYRVLIVTAQVVGSWTSVNDPEYEVQKLKERYDRRLFR